MAKGKHIATHGIYSAYGTRHRIGTGYIYKFEDIGAFILEKGFRWRNPEAEADYLDWLIRTGA